MNLRSDDIPSKLNRITIQTTFIILVFSSFEDLERNIIKCVDFLSKFVNFIPVSLNNEQIEMKKQ